MLICLGYVGEGGVYVVVGVMMGWFGVEVLVVY